MSELARGTYRYWTDGGLQPVEEPWALSRAPDGSVRLRGERRVSGSPVLAVEAAYQHGGWGSLELRWTGARKRHRHYRLRDSTLQWRDSTGPGWRNHVLPEGTLLFPLLRAASGPVLRELLKGPRGVVLPSLRDPDGAAFLEPEVSVRRAERVGDSPDGTHCRYFGGEYGDAGSDYWLAPDGLVTRYRWATPQGTWDVRLEDCERSAPAFGA